MAGLVIGGAALSSIFLGLGYLNHQSAEESNQLDRALKTTPVMTIKELDARLASAKRDQGQGQRTLEYAIVSGHTWAPKSDVSNTINGQKAVYRHVKTHETWEEYSWVEREQETKNNAPGAPAVNVKEKSGRWIATRKDRNATFNKFGGAVHISDGVSHSTVEIDPRSTSYGSLAKLTASSFGKQQQSSNNNNNNNGGNAPVIVNVNTGSSGDSKKPEYIGTSTKEYSILKGEQITGIGHFYLTDDNRVVLSNRNVAKQPYKLSYGSIADVCEEAANNAASASLWSSRFYTVGGAGMVASLAGAAYLAVSNKQDDN